MTKNENSHKSKKAPKWARNLAKWAADADVVYFTRPARIQLGWEKESEGTAPKSKSVDLSDAQKAVAQSGNVFIPETARKKIEAQKKENSGKKKSNE